MAVSLSPHKVPYTSALSSTTLQPYSTSRQFNTIVQTTRPDHESLSINQASPSLLGSSFGHVTRNDDTSNVKLASPIGQAPHDHPSWTPLKNDEGSVVSDSEVSDKGEFATRKAADSALKRPASDTAQAAGAKNTVPAVQTPRLPSNANLSKTKRARFDGVFIATKPPPYRKARTQTQRASASASNARTFSLVDALIRTFDANRHTEDPFPRQSHTALRSRDDIPTAPLTDAETTEAEDERLQLNTRLAHPVVKKQRHGEAKLVAIKAAASDTNSDNATSLVQDVPHERPVKRLKPVQYEANPTLVDVALGTDQAPISWDAELDFITREEDFVVQTQTGHAPAAPADAQMVVDANDHHPAPSSAPDLFSGSGSGSGSVQAPVLDNDRRTLTRGGTVLSPYQSRGAKFRQRLDAIFGENTSVRTDRVARPRPADLDLIATLDQAERAPSPSTSVGASTPSASPAPASTAEEGASAIPSTRITSQSPDVPPTDTTMDDVSQAREQQQQQHPVADASTSLTSGAREEQMMGWTAALQRLVKGKVHVKEEHLEMLSIILAEIESLKGSLDQSHSMTLELRESIKQLSELHEIPFGDRNKLRQRAESIIHSWPIMKEKTAI